MAAVRRSPPARLLIAGTVLMVIGILVIIGFAAAQTGCQNAAMNAVGAVRTPSCTTETVGAAIGWVILVVGGLCFPAAALSTTARFAGRRPPPSELEDRPAE
jgi:hypothetical protein